LQFFVVGVMFNAPRALNLVALRETLRKEVGVGLFVMCKMNMLV